MAMFTGGYIPLNPIKPPFSYGFPMVFPLFTHIYIYIGTLAEPNSCGPPVPFLSVEQPKKVNGEK